MIFVLSRQIENWSLVKKIVASILTFVLLAVIFTIAGNKMKKNEAKLPVVKADVRVVAEGIVVPIRYSTLSSPVGGVVKEIFVKEGQQVGVNQLLLRLANDVSTATVGRSAAGADRALTIHQQVSDALQSPELAMKQAVIEETAAYYQLAQSDYERMKVLSEQKAVSRQELDKSKADYFRAKSLWERAKADYNLLVAQSELTAPLAGTVAFLDCKVGEYVELGTALIRIGDMSAWRIQTDDLTELQISKVQEGNRVTMTFDGLPDVELLGRVIAIRAFGEKKRGDITYTVYIEPERYEPRLKWNMTAVVRIEN